MAKCQGCGRKIKGARPRCLYCGAYPEGYIPPQCSRCDREIPPEHTVCMYCGGPPVGSEDMEVFVARHTMERRFPWFRIMLALILLGGVGLVVAQLVFEIPVVRSLLKLVVMVERAVAS